MIRIGIDIGSTTAKLIAIDPTGKNLFSKYERHNAKAKKVVCEMLREMLAKIGDVDVSVKIWNITWANQLIMAKQLW